MLKEKFIDLLLLKVLCFISYVSLCASLTTCISTLLKVSLNSSSKLLNELNKKMKLEPKNWLTTSDIQFINGFQEDSSRNINLFSWLWLLSDWCKRRLLKCTMLMNKWTSLLKVFLELVLKILWIGFQILLGTWFKLLVNSNNSKHLLSICKRMLQQDSKIGIMSWHLKMLSCHLNGKSLIKLLSKNSVCSELLGPIELQLPFQDLLENHFQKVRNSLIWILNHHSLTFWLLRSMILNLKSQYSSSFLLAQILSKKSKKLSKKKEIDLEFNLVNLSSTFH